MFPRYRPLSSRPEWSSAATQIKKASPRKPKSQFEAYPLDGPVKVGDHAGQRVTEREGIAVARLRYVMELACVVVSGMLAVLTLAAHDWIEVVFGVHPDGGSGLAEVAIVVTLFVVSVALAADVFRLRRLERARA